MSLEKIEGILIAICCLQNAICPQPKTLMLNFDSATACARAVNAASQRVLILANIP